MLGCLSVKSLAHKIQDLHNEINKQIPASNVQYKHEANLHRCHNKFNDEDYVMILDMNNIILYLINNYKHLVSNYSKCYKRLDQMFMSLIY
jgi:hypothetical protein